MDLSLLRFRHPELIVAQTGGASDPESVDGFVMVTGLHPLISVVVSLAFRINRAIGGSSVPTTSTWTISALTRTDANQDFLPLEGTPLVSNNSLPDGFETASAAQGLLIDFTVGGDNPGDYGDWVLTVEAAPVDAALLLTCPELLRELYARIKVTPMQGKLLLINTFA